MKKIIKNTFMLSFGQGFSLFIGGISILIYGIIFSKPQIAIISLFEMVSQLFFSFGFKWSTVGIIRFGKEEYLENNKLNHTSSIRLFIITPILILSIFIILYFRKLITNYVGIEAHWLIFYLILNIIITIANDHITTILNAAEKYLGILFINVAESLGKCIILTIIIIYHLKITSEVYIKILVLWPLFLFFLRLPFLRKNFLIPFEFNMPKVEILKFLKFVYPQIYGFAGLYLINWMDLYFIRQYASMEDLGAYQFIYSIFTRVCTFAFIFNNIFFPRILAWKKNSDLNRLNRYINKIPKIVMLSSILVVSIMIFIYPIIFKYFFENKFTVGYTSFNILLISIPFFMTTYLYIPILNCYDKVFYIQLANILSALVNFLIDYFFIKKFGIIAAATGTFICYFLKYFLLFIMVKRIQKKEWITLNEK